MIILSLIEAVAVTLARLVALLVRLAWRNPALVAAATTAGLLVWLIAPLVGPNTTVALWVIGGAGALAGGWAISRAVLDDRRYEAGIRQREAAETAAATRAGGHTQPVAAGDRRWEGGQ